MESREILPRPGGIFLHNRTMILARFSLLNKNPTGEFFRKGNNRTTIAGPRKPDPKGCVNVCVRDLNLNGLDIVT